MRSQQPIRSEDSHCRVMVADVCNGHILLDVPFFCQPWGYHNHHHFLLSCQILLCECLFIQPLTFHQEKLSWNILAESKYHFIINKFYLQLTFYGNSILLFQQNCFSFYSQFHKASGNWKDLNLMIKFHLNLHIIHLKYISKMAKQQKVSQNKIKF